MFIKYCTPKEEKWLAYVPMFAAKVAFIESMRNCLGKYGESSANVPRQDAPQARSALSTIFSSPPTKIWRHYNLAALYFVGT